MKGKGRDGRGCSPGGGEEINYTLHSTHPSVIIIVTVIIRSINRALYLLTNIIITYSDCILSVLS